MLTEMYSMLMTWRLFSLIATTFLFILWTASAEAHSVEAKAYVTEINQQSNVPDYISQAKVAVKKYYPQYEVYFETILNSIKRIEKEYIDLLNKEIHKNLIIFTEELKTEKDINTTVLMVIEKLIWGNTFCNAKDIIIIDKNEWYDLREWIAWEIISDINVTLSKKLKNQYILMNQQQELTKRVSELYKKEHLTKSEIIELLNIIEELYIITEKINNFDHNKIKKIFSFYESMTKELWRQPNETWKKIIKWLKDHQE